ncbi:MAG TPA: hypothetical protein VGE04_19735 [Chloroflexia bacterium]
MIDTGRKAAKLALTHYEPLAVNLYEEAALEHNEYLVALRMVMRRWVGPRTLRVVVPDLQLVGFEADFVGRCVAGKKSGESGEVLVVIFRHGY